MYLFSFLIGALLCWLVFYVIWNRKLQASEIEQRSLQNELTVIQQQTGQLESKLSSLEAELKARAQKLDEAEAKLGEAEKNCQAFQEQLSGTENSMADMQKRLKEGEEELAACRSELESKTGKAAAIAADLAALKEEKAALADKLASITAPLEDPEPPKADNLQKIEGVGPKIGEILNGKGISTFIQLAQTPVARLKQILEDAGPRYKLAIPDTWPQQAGLAADGDWEALDKLQDELEGGRKKG